LVADAGYFGVFLAALLETIFPPIPSQFIFSLLGFTAQNKEFALGDAIAPEAYRKQSEKYGSHHPNFIK
jgi:membrane protein DedA with SNARE-associated domain